MPLNKVLPVVVAILFLTIGHAIADAITDSVLSGWKATAEAVSKVATYKLEGTSILHQYNESRRPTEEVVHWSVLVQGSNKRVIWQNGQKLEDVAFDGHLWTSFGNQSGANLGGIFEKPIESTNIDFDDHLLAEVSGTFPLNLKDLVENPFNLGKNRLMDYFSEHSAQVTGKSRGEALDLDLDRSLAKKDVVPHHLEFKSVGNAISLKSAVLINGRPEHRIALKLTINKYRNINGAAVPIEYKLETLRLNNDGKSQKLLEQLTTLKVELSPAISESSFKAHFPANTKIFDDRNIGKSQNSHSATPIWLLPALVALTAVAAFFFLKSRRK